MKKIKLPSNVEYIIHQLERAGCPLIGIVLSRVERAGNGYYYKKYGQNYYGKKRYGYNYSYYGDHKK